LGDWVPVKSKTPVEFTSTAYYYADVDILKHAAKIFSRNPDYIYYGQLEKKIKDAFNAKYLDKATGNYDSGYQTELSAALYWKLVPSELVAKTATLLAKRVLSDSVKLDVGLLGTKTILNALSENGYATLAYRLAASEAEPSWGGWIAQGATTLYEGWWPSQKIDYSLNHIMFGEIGAWFYKGLGGIYPDTLEPGFRHVLLRPNIVPQLDSFKAEHTGPYGTIVSGWHHEGGRLIYNAIIPFGSTATLVIDVGNEGGLKKRLLAPGYYQFVLKR
jgi:alpha-L-rhamnosidase